MKDSLKNFGKHQDNEELKRKERPFGEPTYSWKKI